jgi:hypothetical protein
VDPLLLTVIILLGVGLFAVTSYMEWIGVMNLFTSKPAGRYAGCGHVRSNRSSSYERCWRCRHATLGHPTRLIHH